MHTARAKVAHRQEGIAWTMPSPRQCAVGAVLCLLGRSRQCIGFVELRSRLGDHAFDDFERRFETGVDFEAAG